MPDTVNRGKLFWAAALLAAMAGLGAPAAEAASGSGRAAVVIVGPNTLVNITDLDFGNIIPSGTAGTVTVNAQTATRTGAGGITLAGGTVSHARFAGSGTPGLVVTLSSTPSGTIPISRIGGGASMNINQLRVSIDGGTPQPFGPNPTIPNNAQGGSPSIGVLFFAVGGRLNVNANQMEGTYTGSFTINMDYQ